MGKQKRSENTYQKINTIFKRDVNNIIMPYDGFVEPTLEYLRNCKFDCEEKVDGTNIRIEVIPEYENYVEVVDNITAEDSMIPYKVTWSVSYKGKTDNAEVPKKLMKYLQETYTEEVILNALGLKKEMSVDDDFTIEKGWVIENNSWGHELDTSKIPSKYTIYGEGYGAGIQKCGGNYQLEQKLIGFDVKVGDIYLLRENRDEIFNKMNCPIVPFVGQFTIDEAIEYVKKGFISNISENREFLAEGLVCRTPMGLKTRRGERIIFKVKTCDWNKYFAKYGTYDKVDQQENTHY